MNYSDVMNTAARLVNDRGVKYGSIEHCFLVAADIASLKLNLGITPYIVATILESVKDARLAHDPAHEDSHVDGVNYRAMRVMFAPQPEVAVEPAKKERVAAIFPMPSIDPLEEGISRIAANFSPKKD
tara:strand:- start:161 stop:544 length:384 start_codon:yes stop_codon:yes gene_type:complete